MVLESCMVLLDNSEYMRNGDYVPNRLDAQHDAANMIVGTKTQSNPESTVGVIAMTGEMDGSGAELLISPTDDMGKILTALHGVPIRSSSNGGSDGSDITAAIQVASLALKHRRNKNGGQRVVVFVGSPLSSDARALQRCGRQLKKNNIAIDVICLGELEENEPLLQELVNTANGTGDNGANTCHLVSIPPGVLPSDVLVSSPIVAGAGAGMAAAYGASGLGADGAAGADAFAEYGGVDPNMDPELAMALRVSMEEERARQERLAAQRAATEEGKNAQGDAEPKNSSAADEDEGMPDAAAADANPDEDALLQQALAMSMQEDNAAAPPAAEPARMETDEDEDAAMQMALAMSIQEDSAAQSGEGNQFQDPAFVNQLLGSLPGVNPNDPAIQQALQNLQPKDPETKDNVEGNNTQKKD